MKMAENNKAVVELAKRLEIEPNGSVSFFLFCFYLHVKMAMKSANHFSRRWGQKAVGERSSITQNSA
jgi:hypothetical protein